MTSLERDLLGRLVLGECVERGANDRVRVALAVALGHDVGDAEAIQHTGHRVAHSETLSTRGRTQEERAAVPLATHFVVQCALIETVNERKVLHGELGTTKNGFWHGRALADGVTRAAATIAHDNHGTETQDVALRRHLLHLVDVHDLTQETETTEVKLVVVLFVGEGHVLRLGVHLAQILEDTGIRHVAFDRELLLLELVQDTTTHLAAVLWRHDLEAALARRLGHVLSAREHRLVVEVVEERLVELAFIFFKVELGREVRRGHLSHTRANALTRHHGRTRRKSLQHPHNR